MSRKRRWLVVWACIAMFVAGLSGSLQAQQQDRPVMNLLGGLLEAGLREALDSQNNPPSPPPFAYPFVLTPDMAYHQIVAGNARYTRNGTEAANSIPPLSNDPSRPPIATILYSVEMNVRPDFMLDLAPNQLYTIPTRAGVFTSDQLDDLEFGIINLRTPLVVVMTHVPSREIAGLLVNWRLLSIQAQQNAGGGDSFFDGGRNTIPTNDNQLLYSLAGPAVARALGAYPNLSIRDVTRVVAEAIAWQSVEAMLMQSASLRQLIVSGVVEVVAAVADDTTGEIDWLGSHPLTDEFLKTIPGDFITRYQSGNLPMSMIPQSLNNAAIARYLGAASGNDYFSSVTNCYYYRPAPSAVSWDLFRPDVWEYRPWLGFWVRSYIPFFQYYPWYYGALKPNPYWTGRHPDFFIGYNCGMDYHHIPNGFRPHDSNWDKPLWIDPRHTPNWEKDSPWDRIWNHGPNPDWNPAPHPPVAFPPGGPGPVWGASSPQPQPNFNPGGHGPVMRHPQQQPAPEPQPNFNPGGHGPVMRHPQQQPASEPQPNFNPGGHGPVMRHPQQQPAPEPQPDFNPGGHGPVMRHPQQQPAPEPQPDFNPGGHSPVMRHPFGTPRGDEPDSAPQQPAEPAPHLNPFRGVEPAQRPDQPQVPLRFGGFRPPQGGQEGGIPPGIGHGVRPANEGPAPVIGHGASPAPDTPHPTPRFGGFRPSTASQPTPPTPTSANPLPPRLPSGMGGLRHPSAN